MKSPLSILHLEDDLHDAELVQRTLEAAGITHATTCVHNRDDFIAALENGGIDLILSDFSLPAFDGLSAVAITRAGWPHLPVILVSGSLGEELAIDSLKKGATDYVLKQRLSRLGPAVHRAMLEVETRTERHRLEMELIEAQKREVVGQLAGGVAHDFNNILSVIMGYSTLIASELDADNRLQGFVEEIQHASERAVGLTRQLLVFSSQETVEPAVLDLNAVVQELAQMLRRLIDESIELKIVPGPHLGRIKADSGHVGQVLMNLVVNARDAMPNGGKLVVTTYSVSLDENAARAPSGAMPGDYVVLSVADTGTGMTEEVKSRLFEAFFTTKPKGKGTGLGLATCHTIVQQSGGHITVDSELGIGTSFKVYFPQVEQPPDAVAGPLLTRASPRGTETLLVVEDEPSVRHLARGVLEAQGYEVLSAPNGQDALQVVRQHKGAPIRLVVTDVVMPLMGGQVMAEWLKTTDPDLKILFTSGYPSDVLTHQDVAVEFLAKPYTPAILVRRVREMLDEAVMPRCEVEKGVDGASLTAA